MLILAATAHIYYISLYVRPCHLFRELVGVSLCNCEEELIHTCIQRLPANCEEELIHTCIQRLPANMQF